MFNGEPIEKGKSYNIFSKDIDDSEMVRQYKLNPELAYTPQINSAIVESQHKMTLNELRNQGVPDAEAMKIANSARSDAHQRVSRSIKERKSRE
jgi:hypothetical protein